MDPSDFGRLFKMFLGIPGFKPEDRSHFPRNQEDENEDPYNRDPMQRRDMETRNFTVLTDPLEIHRFFEQQMDDMLRNFGFGFGRAEERGCIALEEPPLQDEPKDSLRDFMLKEPVGQPRIDSDIDDDKVDIRDLEKLFKRTDRIEDKNEGVSRKSAVGGMNEDPIIRQFSGSIFGGADRLFTEVFDRQDNDGCFSKSFGTSVFEKSVKLPGGGIETNKTVRNSDGSEVSTVIRKYGDQTHEKIIKRDKNGKETIEDKFINLDNSGSSIENFENKFGRSLPEQPSARQEMMGPPQDHLYGSLWNKFWGN